MQVTTDQLNGRLSQQEAVTSSQDLNALNSTSLSYASGTISSPHNISSNGQVNANQGVAVNGSQVISNAGLVSGNAISGAVALASAATTAGHVSGLTLSVGSPGGYPLGTGVNISPTTGGFANLINDIVSNCQAAGIF
jgi:hypothetical protein